MDAQADLSLHWAHMSFSWFCHEAAIIILLSTVKVRKIWTKIVVIIKEIFYHTPVRLSIADRMANSVDSGQIALPSQIAFEGAVWSWSTLFAQTCLSEYKRLLRYLIKTSNFNSLG